MCTHTHAHTLCPFFSLYFLSLSHTYTDTQSLSLSLTHPTVDVYQGNPKRHHTLQAAHAHTYTHTHSLSLALSFCHLSLTYTHSLSFSLTHTPMNIYQGNPKRHHTLQTAHTHTHTHTHYLSLSLSLLFYHLSLTHTHSLSFTLTHTPVDVYPGNPKKHHTLQAAHAPVGQMLLGSHRPPGLDE